MNPDKMVVRRIEPGKVPPGAQLLSKSEAFNALFEKLIVHRPTYDVWALKYGSLVVAAFASLSGFCMLRHFRRQFGLAREGLLSANAACILVPYIGSLPYHVKMIEQPILLQEADCPVCIELKAVAAQMFFGFVWPYGLTYTSACMTASKLGSYTPSVFKWNYWTTSFQLARGGKGPLILSSLLVANVLAPTIVVYFEGKQIHNFFKRLEIRSMLNENE